MTAYLFTPEYWDGTLPAPTGVFDTLTTTSKIDDVKIITLFLDVQ